MAPAALTGPGRGGSPRSGTVASPLAPALLAVSAGLGLAGRQGLEEWRRTPLHDALLKRGGASGLGAAPRDLRPADPARGAALLAGLFELAGARLEAGVGGDPFDTPCPTRRFAVELHRFGWLPDLLAAGPPGVREGLRLLLAWRGLFDRVGAFAWGAEVIERRVFNLACSATALAGVASDAEASQLAASLSRQARHLARLTASPGRLAERLAVAAVAGAALGGKAGSGLLAAVLPRLSRALDLALLPDGALRTRSPEQGMELLFDLLTLDDALAQRGREVPAAVGRAVDRLSSATRFFALADGRLAAFQGGEAAPAASVAAALAHEDADARPYSYLPQTGYHRLTGRSVQIMADAGGPAEGGWSEAACGQPLAIEVLAGGDRLITNAGWSPDASGPQAMRLTAAASTASLGDRSAGSPLTGWRAQGLGPRLVGGPGRVEARRNENETGVWLELSHDGWLARFGLLHERRLFLDGASDELRGEDHFSRPSQGAQAGGPAAAARVTPYAVRFHLPPEVNVSLARDRRSILLRGASQQGWWLRNDAPEVALEPSVVFQAGLPRRSVQVVLRGEVPVGGEARVRWKLTPVTAVAP